MRSSLGGCVGSHIRTRLSLNSLLTGKIAWNFKKFRARRADLRAKFSANSMRYVGITYAAKQGIKFR